MGVIGSNSDTGCSTCGENGGTNPGAEFAQNNIAREINLFLFNRPDVPSAQEVSDILNGMSYTITEIESPVIITLSNIANTTSTRPLASHTFFFKGGKGKWGDGGLLTTASQFIYNNSRNVTITDIENVGNTETIALGELENNDYLTAANSGERDLSDDGLIYFFSYINNGVLYLVQFIGEFGYYGGSYVDRFVAEDFIDTTSDDVTITPPSIHKPVKIITTTSAGFSAGVYTIQSNDRDSWLSFDIPTAFQIKVPIIFPNNTLIEGDVVGSGQATFVAVAGLTLNYPESESPKTAERYSVFGLKYRTSTSVLLYGRLELL